MRILILFFALCLSPIAIAVDPGQRFEDPVEQARYERLIRDLRCPTCQNESLADSNAIVASDLRRVVHDLILEGRSDAEIRTFLTDRYGDFLLYRPPLSPRTWLLWSAPILFLLGGFCVVGVIIARRARAARANPGALEEEPERP
jgi:cytochrome c-type biogenesis protein CcmH